MKKFLQRMWKNHEIRQQKRADFRILNMYTDRELRDIGIGRSEIRNVIYGKDTN